MQKNLVYYRKTKKFHQQSLRGAICRKSRPLVWHCSKRLLMLSLCVGNLLRAYRFSAVFRHFPGMYYKIRCVFRENDTKTGVYYSCVTSGPKRLTFFPRAFMIWAGYESCVFPGAATIVAQPWGKIAGRIRKNIEEESKP